MQVVSWDKRNAGKALLGNVKETTISMMCGHCWDDDLEIDVQEMEQERCRLDSFGSKFEQWKALVNMGMNLQTHKILGIS